MADTVEKLTTGEPMSIDQLIEYLPALKEVSRAQLENWAKGAAVLHRFRKGEIVCEEGEFGSTAYYIVSGTVDIFINNPAVGVCRTTTFAGKSLYTRSATRKTKPRDRKRWLASVTFFPTRFGIVTSRP